VRASNLCTDMKVFVIKLELPSVEIILYCCIDNEFSLTILLSFVCFSSLYVNIVVFYSKCPCFFLTNI
jgi:hypothetical protein